MLKSADGHKVYLALGATDMRKSIDGLAAIVSEVFQLDPFSPSLFVFCNRGRDRLKILRWEHNGFWLYYRRLERERFRWPQGSEGALAIDPRQLGWMLQGLDLKQSRAHAPIHARTVI